MKIHYLQHVPFEGLGNIEKWAIANHHSISSTKFYANDALPLMEDLDFLIIMGGPMNIYEEDMAVFSRMRGNRILERLTVQDCNTPHSCDYRYIVKNSV